MTDHYANNPYPQKPKVTEGPLPDPFLKPDGGRLASSAEWPQQRRLLLQPVVEMEYGGMPPPAAIEAETLCHSAARRLPGPPRLWSFRIHCLDGARPLCFCVRILFPEADGPVPAVIDGDGCWWYINEEIAGNVVKQGCALVMFNRTELAEDLGYGGCPDKHRRSGGLYDFFPAESFGALSAWAWGYHRVLDLLETLPFIDASRIAVTGHSRGGKAALLAGATDERIALVNDNASCAAGAAVFRYVGDGGETIDILNTFPSWFGDGLRPYLGREAEIPFDQHFLLAAVAPRLLLITYALDDRWSNPEGMVQSAWAAREVYRFLKTEDRLAFHLRAGSHAHAPEDWTVLLDFMGRHWGTPNETQNFPYNRHPYRHMRPAFSWKAPERGE